MSLALENLLVLERNGAEITFNRGSGICNRLSCSTLNIYGFSARGTRAGCAKSGARVLGCEFREGGAGVDRGIRKALVEAARCEGPEITGRTGAELDGGTEARARGPASEQAVWLGGGEKNKRAGRRAENTGNSIK